MLCRHYEGGADTFGEDGAADGGHDCGLCLRERKAKEVFPKRQVLLCLALPRVIHMWPSCRPASTRAVLRITSDIPREVPRRVGVGPHLLSATRASQLQARLSGRNRG